MQETGDATLGEADEPKALLRRAAAPTDPDTVTRQRLTAPLMGLRTEKVPTVALLPWGDRFEAVYDKVGISLDSFGSDLIGGWLFNYVLALRSAGVRTLLVFGSDRVASPVRFTHPATEALISVLPIPRLHRKAHNARLRYRPDSANLAAAASYLATPLRPLIRELRRERCDVILCQEYEYPRFDVGVVLGKALRIPVFATYQGGSATSSRLERPIRSLTVRHSAGLIVASQAEIDRVQETYRVPDEMIGHIPNPVDVDAWRPRHPTATREELGVPQDARVVVWHGHMEPTRKGLDVLFDAWDVVSSLRPDLSPYLLLVGSGRNTAAVRRKVDAHSRILWVDRFVLDQRELLRYISAADIYTLPSRHEGFAVAPLEAMACGLPVVATDISGVRDLLPNEEADGGLIVPSEDPQALAGALLRLLDDPDLSRLLGTRARRRVETQFSIQVVGLRLRDFLFRSDEVVPG